MGERAFRWISSGSGRDAYERLLDIGARHAAFAASEYDTFVRPNLELMTASAVGKSVHEHGHGRQVKTLDVFRQLADEGKRDGSIQADVESEDVAWALLTFAWAEDLARLIGLERFITSGASMRNLERTLAGFATGSPGARADE